MLWEVIDMFMVLVVMVSQVYIYSKTHLDVHIKYVQHFIC